ncbi:MAG: 23S rRNA (adenine(2503)-C(2))-methyltransferase RlmN [Promethearchaeota archaeon]
MKVKIAVEPTKPDIYSYSVAELEEIFVSRFNQPKFRGKQIFQWLYKGISSFQEMSNLPKELRDQLTQEYRFGQLILVKKHISQDKTEKYLVECADNNRIEIVKMEYHHGISACISTQVGCKMHCAFCASGKDGFLRNLTAAEMIEQILFIQTQTQKRVATVVLMGSGEPLDNFEEVSKFFQLVHDGDGLNLGYRHITLSTCGIVPKIADLAQLNIPITLAISLHAPIDEIRSTLVPINQRYPIKQLLQACHDYVAVTKRRITFEYSMIRNINDSPKMAEKLAYLLQNLLCHVNLIPVNSTLADFSPTKGSNVQIFQKILQEHKINATIRRTLGDDINAACGQLKCSFNDGQVN